MSGRIRRSRCCVLTFEGRSARACNFMSGHAAFLDDLEFMILVDLVDWQHRQQACTPLRQQGASGSIDERIGRLIDFGLIVVEGTALGRADVEYELRFAWGPMAGYYHFGIKNPEYMTAEQMSQWLAVRVETVPRVSLFTTNEQFDEVVELGRKPNSELQTLMERRRSWRGFSSDPLPLQKLADCLFAGLAINGFVGTLTPGEGRLPIGMTPSGGGRNPYEAYVYARNVEGLRPAVYHYSATEHSLGLLGDAFMPSVGDVLAGQPWFDGAAALVLLIAQLDRTMWKYPHPTGYRVVLLEAGHIAQNILLAATEHELAAAPTCAVSDKTIEALLGLNSILCAPIYAVALGLRSETATQADIIARTGNPLLVKGSENQRP